MREAAQIKKHLYTQKKKTISEPEKAYSFSSPINQTVHETIFNGTIIS